MDDAVTPYRSCTVYWQYTHIKRNQIGERILGLPRDPLIS
jgi:hypothetical protein